MAKLLVGKPVADSIKEEILKDVEMLKGKGIAPTVAIVRIGERPDDIFYENTIVKRCSSFGIQVKLYSLEKDITMDKVVDLLMNINIDKAIHGILIFRPFPKHINDDIISSLIDPKKDIDCMNPINLEKVFEGKNHGLVPCTPKAVMEILKFYGYNLSGKNVVVINRSMVVGKPLSMMLLDENATVTICHSRTKNISELTAKADVVITAVGRAKMLDRSYFTEASIVIDVSINEENSKIYGDVDFEAVEDLVSAITPVPGGVGSVTTNILLRQVIIACRQQCL